MIDSNALALEYTASHNPHAGSLITFAQFLLVAIAGLRKRLYVAPFQPSNLASLADEIARALLLERKNRTDGRAVKVAIQGEGAEELSRAVAERLRTLSPVSVIRASLAGFVGVRGEVDYEALKEGLLDPLMPGGTQKYVVKVYDREGRPVDRPKVLPTATRKSILLFNGTGLAEGELGAYWDFLVILDDADAKLGTERNEKRPTMIVRDVESKRPRITWTNVDIPMPLLVKVFRLRFRPLKIPLWCWIVQVVLFLATSLLNNAAFKYSIPMVSRSLFN